MTPAAWLLSRDTGISSRAICAVMIGEVGAFTEAGKDGRWCRPSDTGDFGRCYRLLQHFPEWRDRLPEVAAVWPSWAPLIEVWPILTDLYREVEEYEAMRRLSPGLVTIREERRYKEVCHMIYDGIRIARDRTEAAEAAAAQG